MTRARRSKGANNEGEAIEGSEHRGTGADDKVDVAAADALPLIVTFAVGEGAVLNGDALAEGAAKQRGHRRGQCDFGHHQKYAAARLAHTFGKAQIDLGLAAAGDAIEQRDRKGAPISERRELCEGVLLLGRQPACGVSRDIAHGRALKWIALIAFLSQGHEPALRQSADHVGGDAALAQIRQRQTRTGAVEDRQGGLLRGAERTSA
jgi:hypothetical protein